MDLGGVWRVPMYWPGGVRHRGGVTLACGFRRELGKASADTVPWWFDGTIGSAPGGRNREELSTVAVFAGGPSHSSCEAPVMGVEVSTQPGTFQLIQGPVGQEADVDAVQHRGETVDHPGEAGDNLAELVQH